MANDISKIKLPGSTTEYTVKDGSAVANITRSGTTFTATKRDGTTFTFTQQDNNTTYTLSADTTNNKIKLTPSSGNAQSITVPYASSAGSVSIPTANPEIGTYYMPIFGYGTGDTNTPILYKHSNAYQYFLKLGTTSAVGESVLYIGNGSSSGTDGNSRGGIVLYSENRGNSFLRMTDSTSASTYNHYLPAVEGTIGVFTTTPTSGQVVVTDGTAGGFKTTGYTIAKSVPSNAVFTDTNTHRPIQVNGTEILGNNTTALNLKAGSNVSVTNSSGTVTIAATDSHRPIQINAAQFLDSNNIPFNIAAGSNITLVPDVGTATVVIKGTANNAVTQTNSTTNKDYRILLSNSDNDFDETSGSYKSSKLKFNPSTGALTCTGNIYTNSEGVFGTGIELGMYANDSLSFIDFHWNSTNTDWTARIVQRGENTVDLIGKNSSTWGIWRAASFSSQSSIHVKENVQSITAEDARKLLQLRPVTFNYKNGGQIDQAGLIAEEVNLVMPKMVIGDINFNPEEPWNAPSIDYSKFTPYLIKMVQEQQKEIDELRRLVQG